MDEKDTRIEDGTHRPDPEEVVLLARVLGPALPGEDLLERARRLLAATGGARRLLVMSQPELCLHAGVGPGRGARLKAGLDLAVRALHGAASEKFDVRSSRSVADVVRPLAGASRQEHFFVLVLDTRGGLLHVSEVSRGTLNAALVHPREVFLPAITLSGAAVVVAHNHPSGDPSPSVEDLALTRQLVQSGEVLGLPVLDHVILGHGCHHSLREAGQMGCGG